MPTPPVGYSRLWYHDPKISRTLAIIGGVLLSGIYLVTCATKTKPKDLEAAAITEIKAEHAAEYNKKIEELRKNARGFYKGGVNLKTMKPWGVVVPNTDYIESKERSREIACPNDIVRFVGLDLAVDRLVEDAAEEITEGFATDAEKAQAIFSYLRRHVKHLPRSGTPASANYPIETFVEGAGNDTDLAVLASSMLEAAGLDSAILYFPQSGGREACFTAGVKLDLAPVASIERVAFPFAGGKAYVFATYGSDSKGPCRAVGQAPLNLKGRGAVTIEVDW